MSAARLVVLSCDVCGTSAQALSGCTCKEARLYAVGHWGWHYHHSPGWLKKYGGKDVCPGCYASADHRAGRKPEAARDRVRDGLA